MISSLSAKLPKLVAASLTALKQIVTDFGVPTVNPKPVLKQLSTCTELTVELYRWLGDAIRPALSELKPVQLKELDEAFKKVEPGTAKPVRQLNSQKLLAAKDSSIETQVTEAAEELSSFDLADPVEILDKLPSDFQDSVASAKWKDRKEALDALLAATSVPKIKDDNYHDIVGILAKCMKDANVGVVTVAAQCISAMAQGLKSDFGRYRNPLLSAVIDKLKERKQSVVDALSSALDGIFFAVSVCAI